MATPDNDPEFMMGMRRQQISVEFTVALLMDDTATADALKAEYQSLANEAPVVQSPSAGFLARNKKED